MSSEGLPVSNIVGTSVELGARSVQDAANAASSSQNADSAAASADAAWKFSRKAQASAEAAAVASDVLRVDLEEPTGVYLVGGVLPIWRVGDHGGDFAPGMDISTAFNLTAATKGSQPGEIVLPSTTGTLLVSADSLRIPKNTMLDLQGNTLKLADGASKYVIRNDEEDTIGGFVKVTNGIIDGNRPGGQSRRFDNKKVNANGLSYYDYRENYPGFAMMFSYVDKLTVTDVHVKNSEGWSIAHFRCNDALFDNVSFDTTEETGRNADGITGVGTKRTEIRHLRGYTNDDMCAISTSRATVGSYAIFNPLEGANIEAFTVSGVLPIKKGTHWPHVGVGVYVSDAFEIDLVTLRDIRGYFNLYVARFGNYWNNPTWNAPDGVIHRVLVENAYATSYTTGNADFYAFHVPVYHFDIKGVDANKELSLVGTKNKSPIFQSGDGAMISYLNLDNVYYFNESTPTDGQRNSMIDITATGGIMNLTLNIAMGFSLPNVAKNTILSKHSAETTTLNVIRASLGFPSMQMSDFVSSSFNEENLYTNDGGGTIRIGACFNFKMRKPLTLLNGVTSGSNSIAIYREGNRSYITGYVTLPPSYTQGTKIAEIPQWAIPFASSAYPVAAVGDSTVCRVRVESTGLSAYPSISAGGPLFLDGVSWESGVRLSYTP